MCGLIFLVIIIRIVVVVCCALHFTFSLSRNHIHVFLTSMSFCN